MAWIHKVAGLGLSNAGWSPPSSGTAGRAAGTALSRAWTHSSLALALAPLIWALGPGIEESLPRLLARMSLSSRVADRMRKTLQSSSSVKVFARIFMRVLRLLACFKSLVRRTFCCLRSCATFFNSLTASFGFLTLARTNELRSSWGAACSAPRVEL